MSLCTGINVFRRNVTGTNVIRINIIPINVIRIHLNKRKETET